MIDLHLHTNNSDGTDTTEELLINAEKNKLEIISITDHDSIDAYYDIENKNLRNLYSGKIIVGAELKTHYNKVPIEVLAYGIDYTKMKILKIDMYDIQVKALEEFKRRGKNLGFKFDDSITVSRTDNTRKYASFVFAKEIMKYEENEQLLLSFGVKCDPVTFYRVHASNKNSVFYYDETEFSDSLDTVVKNIHDAGGLAFIAHPYLYPFEDKNKAIEEMLLEHNLDGLECEYPLFSNEERNELKLIAKKHNKFVSGGTDYHAKTKPNVMIGTGIDNNINISADLINDWIDKVNLF